MTLSPPSPLTSASSSADVAPEAGTDPRPGVGVSAWLRRTWALIGTGVWIGISRVTAGVLVAHAVLALFPQSLVRSGLGTLSTGSWLGAFDRWDARYYLTIAAHGYPAHAPDVRAFFPGYPIVVRAAYLLTGGIFSYPQVGCLVSFAAFALASGLLYRLASKLYGVRAALVSTLIFCWFPTSCFFLAPYSESLFALQILAVATLIDRGKWWWAAGVAGYASATSPESAALTGALLVAALISHRGARRSIGYALVGSLGAAAYIGYLGIRFGKPFQFGQVLPDFHRTAVVPLFGLIENLGSLHHAIADLASTKPGLKPFAYNIIWMWLVDDAAVVLALCALVTLVVVTVRKRRAAGADATEAHAVARIVLLAGITLLASATVIRSMGSSASTEGAARLVSVAFPMYLGLYLMVRRWQAPIIIGLSLTIAAALVTQIMFNLGYWVT